MARSSRSFLTPSMSLLRFSSAIRSSFRTAMSPPAGEVEGGGQVTTGWGGRMSGHHRLGRGGCQVITSWGGGGRRSGHHQLGRAEVRSPPAGEVEVGGQVTTGWGGAEVRSPPAGEGRRSGHHRLGRVEVRSPPAGEGGGQVITGWGRWRSGHHQLGRTEVRSPPAGGGRRSGNHRLRCR